MSYLVAQNINPFTGLGELGSELNDLRSLVVFVILLFGLGMLYLLVDKNRQRTKRLELENRGKVEAIHAEEGKQAAQVTQGLLDAYLKTTEKMDETNRILVAALERNSTETNELQKAFTEAVGIIGNLPAGIIAGVEILANRNLDQYNAQFTGLGMRLQNIDAGLLSIKQHLSGKIFISPTDAEAIKVRQEKLLAAIEVLIGKHATGEFPAIPSEDKKEGE